MFAAFTDHEVVHSLHYHTKPTAWMHASFKMISFLRRTSTPSLALEFHLVSRLEDTPVPQPTKDDVLSFLTRYPDAPRHHFEPIVTGRIEAAVGQVHCEAQLMTLVYLKASGLAHELPMGIPVYCKFSSLLALCTYHYYPIHSPVRMRFPLT